MNYPIRNLPLMKAVIAFMLGLMVSDTLGPLSSKQVLLSITLMLSLALFSVIGRGYSAKKSSCLLLSFFLLGVVHMFITSPLQDHKHFSNFVDANFLKLTVLDFKNSGEKVRAICQVDAAGYTNNRFYPASGKLMVYFETNDSTSLTYGTEFLTTANYFLEKKNTNPHIYDYKKYLNYRGIYHRMHLASSEFLQLTQKQNDLKLKAAKIKEQCKAVLAYHISDSNALAVAAAMVLGERNLLTDELYEAFTDTGAVHVLAVSGLHVGIVSWLVMLLLGFLKGDKVHIRVIRLVICLSSIWAFALITGGAAAVTRAAIMFSLFFLGRSLNKSANAYNILASAALLMLIYDPNYLFQAGFQFSFLALGGIIFFYPYLKSLIKSKNKVVTKTWEMICVSIAAQTLVSPFAIYYFHKLPTYFWVTGLFAIPFAFAILGLGLFLIGSHVVLGSDTIITELLGVILEKCLLLFNYGIFNIQQLPYCSTDGLWISNISLILIYLFLGLLSLFLYYRKPRYLTLGLACLLSQSIIHNIENKILRSERKLVVYDIYDESHIDLFYDGYLTTFNTLINNPSRIEYVTANNRMAQRVIKNPKLQEVANLNRFYMLSDKLVCLYPDEGILQLEAKQELEALVLSKDSYQDLHRLSKAFVIKLLVLDGTFDKRKYSLKRSAEKLGIPIHITSIDGALELDI